MKLGTQTGSLVNHLYTNVKNRTEGITVGMGATVCHWSDRHAASVIRWDGRILTIQGDTAIRLNPGVMTDAQQYRYEPNPDGGVSHWRIGRKGQWEQVRRRDNGCLWVKTGSGAGLVVGVRDEHYDYSF